MTIELHTWNTPNGRKISVAMEEMGLPYKVIPVNISKKEQFAPAFLAISPNNKIPAIVDPDGPGGARVSVFESGAILLYLGEKTGLKRFSAETVRLYGVLDRRLADHEFVAGALSVADFAILGWAWRHERHKVSFKDFPNVGRWYDQLMERPGVKRGFEAKLD
jgi:GST-like protein